MSKYEDIINLPHHVSKTRNRMTLEQRSAQFAPFQALDGYSNYIKESERTTLDRIIISESRQEILNQKLNIIKNSSDILIKITYFIKDKFKSGGCYKTISGYIKKIDELQKLIIVKDNIIIPIKDIINIELCYNDNGGYYE